ncbi:MAG: carbon-nitrogen hydrolase family protein [Alphaproteobacteria bacterium]|nr:carbon-nitrogen hydrolase family protein [Alphaproteobacteria bacterium]
MTQNTLTVACIQTNSTPDLAANLDRARHFIREARKRGADFIALPENVSLIGAERDALLAQSPREEDHQAVAFFRAEARKTGAWILAGSIPVSVGEDRLANRSFLFSPRGEVAARYDKIHMFDATLSDTEVYRESRNYRPGSKAVIADTPWGKIGMTICYDLRFPQLHRALAKAGASILTIPAAFVATTGRLHWHVLVRARAIETGCFVIAPGQCGMHNAQRLSYGHSLIVAPNGQILAEAGEQPGIIMAEIDLADVVEARRKLPNLTHDCAFDCPE